MVLLLVRSPSSGLQVTVVSLSFTRRKILPDFILALSENPYILRFSINILLSSWGMVPRRGPRDHHSRSDHSPQYSPILGSTGAFRDHHEAYLTVGLAT